MSKLYDNKYIYLYKKYKLKYHMLKEQLGGVLCSICNQPFRNFNEYEDHKKTVHHIGLTIKEMQRKEYCQTSPKTQEIDFLNLQLDYPPELKDFQPTFDLPPNTCPLHKPQQCNCHKFKLPADHPFFIHKEIMNELFPQRNTPSVNDSSKLIQLPQSRTYPPKQCEHSLLGIACNCSN